MSESKHVWVFLETEDGQLRSVGLELLGQGRLLADKMGEQLVGVILDPHAGTLAAQPIACAAPTQSSPWKIPPWRTTIRTFSPPPCATSCANTRPKCS